MKIADLRLHVLPEELSKFTCQLANMDAGG